MKKILMTIGVIAVIVLIVFIISKLDCAKDIRHSLLEHGIISLVTPHFVKPSDITHTEIKPDTTAIVQYDSIPDVTHISGGTIYPNGDLELEVKLNDSLFGIFRYKFGGWHGTGHIVIENGMPKIYYPRFGVDWAGFIGPSIHGINAGVEHIYINNFLGVTHVHPLTPMIELPIWEDSFALQEDIYLGIGATADIAPRSFPSLRLGIGWLWQTTNLKNDRLTVSIGIALP